LRHSICEPSDSKPMVPASLNSCSVIVFSRMPFWYE